MIELHTESVNRFKEKLMMGWHPISVSPPDLPLQLCVIDEQGIHPLRFPCRLSQAGWVNAVTNSRVLFSASHWREWKKGEQATAAETSARIRINQLLIGAELPTLYDEFLRQPLPPELAKLLDEFAQREIEQLSQQRWEFAEREKET